MPPQNNINAMISFGNVVLYNLISNDIHKTQLDVKIGYLHATGRRRQSLNLDIAEIFKPIIVDRVIFTLIRKHQITNSDFMSRNGGIYLSPDGKRIFLKYFYQKLNSTLTIDGKCLNYDGLIWREIRAFQKSIIDDSIYYPLHFRI